MKYLIATLFYIGLLPAAQGSAGSALALVIGFALYELAGLFSLIIATIVVTIVGFWSTSGIDPTSDPASIIIDEAAGQMIALIPVPILLNSKLFPENIGVLVWLAAFALFRLFDILKPSVIGWVDRSHMRGSIMIDDLLAGAATCILFVLVWLVLVLLIQ